MMKKIRNFFRYTSITLIIIVAAGFLIVKTPYFQERAIIALKSAIFNATGVDVDVKEVAIELSGNLAAYGVAIAEAHGEAPWLTADEVGLKIDLQALWQGQLKTLALRIDNAVLLQIPKLSSDKPNPVQISVQTSSATTLVKANLPEIDVTLLRMTLSPSVLKQLNLETITSLELDGTMHLALNDGVKVDGDFGAKVDVGTMQTTLQGHLTHSPDHTQIDLTANTDAMRIQDLAIGGIEATISAQIEKGIASGQATAITTLEGNPIQSSAGFAWQPGGALALTGISVKAAEVLLEGALNYYPHDGSLEGQLAGAIEDLSKISLPGLKDVSGAVSLSSTFERTDGHVATVDIKSRKLSINGFTAKGFKATTLIHDFFSSPTFSVHVAAGKIYRGAFAIKNVEISTSIDSKQSVWPFDFHVGGGRDEKSLRMQFEGSWHISEKNWQATLANLKGQAATIGFNLRQPVTILANAAAASISPIAFNIDIGGGTADVDLAITTDRINGTIELKDISVEQLVKDTGSLPAKGIVSGHAEIKGALSDPEAIISLHLSDFNIAQGSMATIPPATGDLSAKLDARELVCQGALAAPDHPPINFDFRLPVNFSLLPMNFAFETQKPISGKLTAGGEIAPLFQLLFSSAIPFSGNATAAVDISGTLEAPKLNGSCDLVNGFYEIPEIGISLFDLSAHIEADGPNLKAFDVKANDGKGGEVTGTGFAVLDPEKHFPFQLDLVVNKAMLLNLDYTQAICSGPLVFKGDGTAGQIIANLHLEKGRVTIPDRSPAVINSVDVTYINIPENEPLPQTLTLKRESWPLSLDINLEILDNLRITGRDLKSMWKGKLVVQGAAAQPQINGQLLVVSGEYLFNGNPFEINEGTITFAGDLERKTSIYVIASKDLDKVKVDVIAKGPVKNPQISFRSNPPLPQREILSWILFNRGTTEISPFQGTQLSESVTNLKSNQQGPDVLAKIRSTLGIDRFELSRNPNSDSNEVNVQVGKYITDNVLVSVIKSDVNSLAVEAALLNRVKLQAQVGDDAQGQLILKWKRNY